ncbi:hypothetical protein [Anatilimnocola floriformis]|uniref:hypothetical protein n=1 Tax=Anatilimnocola floriformis TaxID=2948575 RepID=UPI0020C30B74|nr:hypothetical protein [Anatilimnocola floriformis]
MPRFLLIAALLLGLPIISGCALPYAYPKVDFTRALQIAASPDEVHVFRVDIGQVTENSHINYYSSERLTELTVGGDGQVATQIKPSLPVGVYLLMGALNHDFRVNRTLELRAYRPGFWLVKVESMEKVKEVVWTPALNVEAQERALDGLFSMPYDAEQRCSRPSAGSTSADHRRALLYGASEYKRVAAIAELADEQARLLKKAESLKERALE